MTSIQIYQPTGTEYLKLVTDLLQRQRQLDPIDGIWEAADFQWWWRRDQHNISANQTFWLDSNAPVAAVIITDWGNFLSCDLLYATHEKHIADLAWSHVLKQLDSFQKPVEFHARDDDKEFIHKLVAIDFAPSDEVIFETWMFSKDRPKVTLLAEGFKLVSRRDTSEQPHHMIRRNGDHVAERLAECSLYNLDLDLAIYAPNGEVAAYSLFWADPVTKVGLVEPMRTEDKYQRLGLGRHILTSGLERLASLDCTRFKVSYAEGNQASQKLYISTGFKPFLPTRTYHRKS